MSNIEAVLPPLIVEVTLEWADYAAVRLPSMYANGESFAEVCSALGVNKEQYKEACRISERFDAADRYSQVVHEAWWNKQGREKGVTGRSINGAIWNHTMNNRYGWSNNGNTDDGSKGRTLNLGIVFMGTPSDGIEGKVREVVDGLNPDVSRADNVVSIVRQTKVIEGEIMDNNDEEEIEYDLPVDDEIPRVVEIPDEVVIDDEPLEDI